MFEYIASGGGDASSPANDVISRAHPSPAAVGSLAAPRFGHSPHRLAATDYVDFEFLRNIERAVAAAHPRLRRQP